MYLDIDNDRRVLYVSCKELAWREYLCRSVVCTSLLRGLVAVGAVGAVDDGLRRIDRRY